MYDHLKKNTLNQKQPNLELTVRAESAQRMFRVRSSFTHRSCGKLERLCHSVTFPDLQLTEMRV